MGATNHTANLLLPQFSDNDKPTWRGDVNGAFADIDTAHKTLTDRVANNEAVFQPSAGAVVSAIRNGVSTSNTAAQNTAALNALLTSSLANGLTIDLPAGVINVNTLSIKANLRGAGKGKTTLRATGLLSVVSNGVTLSALSVLTDNPYAFSVANVTDFNAFDVAVDFTAAVTTNWLAFDLYNVDRLRVMRCNFHIGGLQLSLCDDFLIDGNYWYCDYLNTNEACHISGKSYGQFVNNTVYQSAQDAVDLYSSGKRCVIANNRFYGLRGGAGIECKVTMSDDAGNTSTPDSKFEATIIANNVLADFNVTATGTRVGIYAEYIDNRAVPAFSVAESNRAIIITGNILDSFNDVNPGAAVIASYWGICYTGHNGLIANNVVSNIRAWNGASPVGIKCSAPANTKCVGTRIAGNSITGIEGGSGIDVGSMDRCQIDGNIVRGIEETSVQTRYGVSIAAGKTLTDCSISGNLFECNYATGYGIRVGSSACSLVKCNVQNNVLRDCGVALGCGLQWCSFIGNTMDNALNSQSFSVGIAGAASRGNKYIGNHIALSDDIGFVVNDHDGFVMNGNTFNNTQRAILLIGATRNGVVSNNVIIVQSGGSTTPSYSGVSAGDQATVVGVNNLVLAA